MSCQKCTADTAYGIALCDRCRKTAEVALTNIVAYYADLDRVPVAQRVRRSSNGSDPTGIEASGVRIDPVSAADDDAVNTLTTWARCLVDDRPRAGTPPRAVPDIAPWLKGHLDSIVTCPWAGAMLRDLLDLERLLKRVAARAKTGQYLGTCGNEVTESRRHDETSCWCACHLGADACDVPGGCGREYGEISAEVCDRPLYAAHDARWVTCRCGATWDARARRQQLIRAAEDELAPVAVIAHLAAAITGEESVGKVEARINQWVHRKKITHVTTKVIDGRERRVFRMGDVLDLLVDTPGKTTDRDAS